MKRFIQLKHKCTHTLTRSHSRTYYTHANTYIKIEFLIYLKYKKCTRMYADIKHTDGQIRYTQTCTHEHTHA